MTRDGLGANYEMRKTVELTCYPLQHPPIHPVVLVQLPADGLQVAAHLRGGRYIGQARREADDIVVSMEIARLFSVGEIAQVRLIEYI